MPRENTNQFIIEKIKKLQSALFFPEITDWFFPSCVLQQVKTDDQEQIWFAVSTPAHVMDPNKTSFPCRMDFFRKGADFHLKINGLATIMDGATIAGYPLQLPGTGNSSEKQKQLIIKVQIQQADYFEIPPMPSAKKHINILDFVSNTINKMAGQLLGKAPAPRVTTCN